jgi:tetratricopeptide (TPR) repeat protein
MRPLVILLLFAVIPANFAHAAEQWVRLTTPHFELLTTAGEKKGREGVLYFETVRQFFVDIGIGRNTPEKRVRIVAFRNDKEFRPYAPNEFATAFYAGGADNDYIVLSQIGSAYYPVAVHEYTHLVVRHGSKDLPIWMNEGLAEFFSTLRPLGKKVAVGDVIRGHLEEVTHSRLIDLNTLFAVDHESPLYNQRNHAGLFYAESWAVVHMLFASDAYMPKFPAFLKLAVSGQNSAAALRQVYGKSVDEVQRDLMAYLRDDHYRNMLAAVKLDQSAEDPQVQPVSAWDADLALAEIMSSSQRQEAIGKKMLERLMAEDPKRPEAPAILAELALREGKTEDAIGLFAKASELGATNPEMYYRYAMMLWNRSGGGDEAIVKALRKAVELKPDYGEARMRLGFALIDHGDYQQALMEFIQVKSVTPADAFSFFRAAAYADYRLGDEASARIELERARKAAKDAADRMAVDQLSEALERRHPKSPEDVPEPAPVVSQTGSAETVIAEAHFPRMEGTLANLECSGEKARLAIISGGRTIWFLIEDPGAVRMTNAGGGSVDFTCGTQTARPVAIDYQSRADSQTKTIGVVRGIEFR